MRMSWWIFSVNSSLQNSFYQVQVVYDFSESILISSKDYRAEDTGLLLTIRSVAIVGLPILFSELIAEWQLYNIYAVPKEIQEWINKKFPSVRFWHQYTLAIKYIVAAATNGSLLVTIFVKLTSPNCCKKQSGDTGANIWILDSWRYFVLFT